MSISGIITISRAKKVLSLLMMVLFLFDFSIPTISFIYNKKVITKEIKKLVKDNLPLEKITILEISQTEIKDKSIFRWIHDREFCYRGNMYDILAKYPKIINKNITTFYVFHDVKEEDLIQNFAGNSTSPFSDILKTIKNFSFDLIFDINSKSFEFNYIKIALMNLSIPLVKNVILIDSPPPKKL